MKPRPIRIVGNDGFVTLTQGREAIIDASDAPAIGRYNWRLLTTPSGRVYATRSEMRNDRQVHVLLHRQVVGAPPERDVDHRDGDGLNNRRANLRLCEPAQNMANTGPMRTNSLGIKGVVEKAGRFQATIQSQGRTTHLGYFGSAEEAGDAYRSAAKALHGEFAA